MSTRLGASHSNPRQGRPLMAAYVPIDLHRHRSVVMHMAGDGEVLGWVRLANDPATLVAEVRQAGEDPQVAIEATYGWYWAVDALMDAGLDVHLVAPSKVGAFDGRRVKNDQRDCQLLGDLLRAGMLPEAWIAPPEVREWRECDHCHAGDRQQRCRRPQDHRPPPADDEQSRHRMRSVHPRGSSQQRHQRDQTATPKCR